MTELNKKTCVPCQGGVPPMSGDAISKLMPEIDAAWSVVDQHHLVRTWGFPDFITALEFLNSTGAICELEGHHADFEIGWGRVVAQIWTHKIDGLTESDFILAAKLDQL